MAGGGTGGNTGGGNTGGGTGGTDPYNCGANGMSCCYCGTGGGTGGNTGRHRRRYGRHRSDELRYRRHELLLLRYGGGGTGGGMGTGGNTGGGGTDPMNCACNTGGGSSMWSILSGSQYCSLYNGGSCVGNEPYHNNERCNITALQPLYATAHRFDTESFFDYLSIGRTRYSGSMGPTNVRMRANDNMTWHTDGSVTDDGWYICGTSSPDHSRAYAGPYLRVEVSIRYPDYAAALNATRTVESYYAVESANVLTISTSTVAGPSPPPPMPPPSPLPEPPPIPPPPMPPGASIVHELVLGARMRGNLSSINGSHTLQMLADYLGVTTNLIQIELWNSSSMGSMPITFFPPSSPGGGMGGYDPMNCGPSGMDPCNTGGGGMPGGGVTDPYNCGATGTDCCYCGTGGGTGGGMGGGGTDPYNCGPTGTSCCYCGTGGGAGGNTGGGNTGGNMGGGTGTDPYNCGPTGTSCCYCGTGGVQLRSTGLANTGGGNTGGNMGWRHRHRSVQLRLDRHKLLLLR